MRTSMIRIGMLLVAALLLVACTRDRPTPEATNTPVVTVTPASSSAPAEPTVQRTTPSAAPTATATEAAKATTTPEASAPKKTFAYTVKAGDTLQDIATKFESKVQTLRELNFLLDDNIFAGQILNVPYIEGMTAEGAPTPTPAPFKYTVQSGDTLDGIAIEFGVPRTTLIEVNSIADPNNLPVGFTLLIPGYQPPANSTAGTASGSSGGSSGSAAGSQASSTGSTGSGGAPVTHVVQPGETLSTIAADYGVDQAELAQANNIANGNLIRAGQKLVIPGVTQQQAQAARGQRHVVQAGESLSAIAQQYGVSVDDILALNGLSDPNKIMVGQQLLIPPKK